MFLIAFLPSLALFLQAHAHDPNDDFWEPTLVVVLNGQTRHVYHGEVVIKEHSTQEGVEYNEDDTLSATPELHEDIEEYNYEVDFDPFDIRVPRIHQLVHSAKVPRERITKQANLSDYEIVDYLGDGTFSFVTRAIRKSDGQSVVLKQVKSEYMYYFEKEAKILKLLKQGQHKNTIVQVLDCFLNGTEPVIEFSDLADSKTFDYKTYYNDLNLDEIKLYFRKLFLALSVAHSKGVMHLDIKPANIIFSGDNIQIIDWGVSDFYHPLKQYRSRVGTRHYRAPEQLIHYKYTHYSVDVWAMGCILAGAVFRKQPFFDGRHNDDQLIQVVRVLGTNDFFDFCSRYNIEVPENLKLKLSGYDPVPLVNFRDAQNQELATDEAIDLLGKILVYDPVLRLTADEVLQHPFFKL